MIFHTMITFSKYMINFFFKYMFWCLLFHSQYIFFVYIKTFFHTNLAIFKYMNNIFFQIQWLTFYPILVLMSIFSYMYIWYMLHFQIYDYKNLNMCFWLNFLNTCWNIFFKCYQQFLNIAQTLFPKHWYFFGIYVFWVIC